MALERLARRKYAVNRIEVLAQAVNNMVKTIPKNAYVLILW